MSIANLIVHEVQKNTGSNKAVLVARPTENAVDEQAAKLAEQIGNLFNRSGMNTGQFSNPEGSETGAKLPGLLTQFYSNNVFSDFAAFSKACASDFVTCIGEIEEAEGGLLWFNHYELHDTHFLFIALLKRKHGMVLNADLSLSQIEQIELEKLHMAMRINLSAWADRDDSRYISFRFGRAAKVESDYFTRFIGCDEPKVTSKETRKLVDVTSAYCDMKSLSVPKANELKRVVAEHCLSKAEENERIDLNEIAKEVEERFSPDEAGLFMEIAESESFALDRDMFVEKAALKKLTRYSGSTRTLTLSFDSSLLGDSVRFDEETNSLVINDLPKTLLKQLKK
ncbi:nucleoid-associated protein [Marinomonas algicola]|uniref:nucleoid-associated protein n=1 Tax=Marinomonas algicola TaxID=2773454 RepID=UPI00174E07CB|nr:nucleoid-associated protein [Marinomonas algicola]